MTTHLAVRGLKFICVCAIGAFAAQAMAQTAATRPSGTTPPTTPPKTGTVIITPQTSTTNQPPANTGGGDKGPIVSTGLNDQGSIRLLLNKSAVLTTSRPYRRISVGEAQIADVNGIGPNRVLVTAKKAGSTQIILWDDQDNSQMIDVTVQADLAALRELYPMLFPDAKIDIVVNEGTVALVGRVPNLTVGEQAVMIAQCYSQRVINLLEVGGGQQVALQVRFAEVSRSATNQLGVNLAYSTGGGLFASNVGQLSPFNLTDAGALGIPSPTATITQFGRIGIGDGAITILLTALRRNNLARVLAEPNLVATSGQEATFLAGGEFPVPIPQTGTGDSTTITIEFKEFGVRLTFLPVVLGNGRIRMKVMPEVSQLDFTNAVQLSGFRVPGLTTRKLATTIEMNDGQTFALAGLLNNQVTAVKDVTPFVGDLPIIGPLFRSVRYQQDETELVVVVTPRLVEAMNPGQVPALPGEKWRHPNEAELFLNQDLGGPKESKPEQSMPDKTEEPRPFIGSYGFMPAAAPAHVTVTPAPAPAAKK